VHIYLVSNGSKPQIKEHKTPRPLCIYGALQQAQCKTAGGGDWQQDLKRWDENSFVLGVEVEKASAGLEFLSQEMLEV
jgi:hypothetical protein